MGENGKATESDAVVKEFVSNGNRTDVKKKAAKARQAYAKKSIQFSVAEFLAKKSFLALTAYALAVIAAISLSVFVCEIPVVAVCLIVVIETLLAACLHDLPVWLHAIVIAAELACGIIFDRALYMLLEAALYLVAIFVLKIVRQEK
jgi:hypothetical protein